jgi:hypothetical protein
VCSAHSEKQGLATRSHQKAIAMLRQIPRPSRAGCPKHSLQDPRFARPAVVAASKQSAFDAPTITPRGFLVADSVFRSREHHRRHRPPFLVIPNRNSASQNTHQIRFSPLALRTPATVALHRGQQRLRRSHQRDPPGNAGTLEKVYKGALGELRACVPYSHSKRQLFASPPTTCRIHDRPINKR